ncbi:MAG TPA: flavodoxin domain-containing protein [Gemmatimonadaceae bacterium]|nr:flavodoxin domain-containing protein [Gemmatimonadaceae bacterium]
MTPRHILIVYGTKYGQTAKIAERMRQRLADEGNTVTLIRGDALPQLFSLEPYDAVIVGASLILGRHQKYIERFVREHVAELNALPSAFFSVSGSAASPEPAAKAEARRKLEEFLAGFGWQPLRTTTIAGAIAYTKYGPLTRLVMRLISRAQHGSTDVTRDHEYTDWAQVDRFAESIVETAAAQARAEELARV